MNSCQNFSSSVIRPRRSCTRSSTERRASRYGGGCCGDSASAEAASRNVSVTRRGRIGEWPLSLLHFASTLSLMAAPACDVLLTNALVLTMDGRFTVHRWGAVAIAGDSIAAVGPDALTYQAADTVDC